MGLNLAFRLDDSGGGFVLVPQPDSAVWVVVWVVVLSPASEILILSAVVLVLVPQQDSTVWFVVGVLLSASAGCAFSVWTL